MKNKIVMNGCGAEKCGDGLFISKNAKVEVNGFLSKDNKRNGVIVDEESETTLNNVIASGNGEYGILIVDTTLLKKLGLPSDTSHKDLQDLIEQLKITPKEKRKSIINESFLAGLNNLTSIANNILQMLPN